MQIEAAPFDWISPLKPPAPKALPKNGSSVRLRLFGDDVEQSQCTLSELYKFQLEKPPFIDFDHQFSKMRGLVSDIEASLKNHTNSAVVMRWRERVSNELRNKNFDKKMAELGAILFYIAKDDANLEIHLDTPSLLEYRAQELHKEVESYIQSTQSAALHSCIPSGKIHYLMRAFAHMVLTKDHVYNRGGLIAIRELLSNPQYRLAKYLQHEHRDHILIVIKELLAGADVEKIFNDRVDVDESLKDLIRIDLKLKCDRPVDSIHILYDCLMALFADVRQHDYPNCYAIASLMYATENYTTGTLRKILEWLRVGYHSFEGVHIPIRSLLNGRLATCRDFTVPVNAQSIFTLAPLGHIQSTLSLKAPSVKESVQQPLEKALKVLQPDSSKKEQLNYITKLYNGYKYNTLIDMQVAILEFETYNSSSVNKAKGRLIYTCIAAVQWANRQQLTLNQIEILRQKLSETLWLQPCYEQKVCLKDGTIKIGSENVLPFAGHDTSLLSLLNSSIRVFNLKKDVFHAIYTISDLQQVVHAIMQELGVSGTINPIRFADSIAQLCRNAIGSKFGVSAETLKKHNLLVFSQDGGYLKFVLDHVYKVSVVTHKIFDTNTPYHFLEKLFTLFRGDTLRKITVSPRVLLSSSNQSDNHVWTIHTRCWKIFSSSTHGFSLFVKKNIFDPAHRRLDSVITQDTVMRCISRHTKDENEINTLASSFRKVPNPTFRDVLKMFRRLNRQSSLRDIVDGEFSKLCISKRILSYALNNLKITVSTAVFEKIYSSISHEASFSYMLARDLRLALIENKVAVLDPHDIDHALCIAAGLPLSINVGDLNWTEEYTEDPVHTTLWIRYSYWDDTPGYFIRRNTSEFRTQNKHYRNILIYHPKVMAMKI